jgi:uncharacterized membrane protein
MAVFHVLVFLHLVCVIGGFGFLAYNGVFLNLLRRRGAVVPGAIEANRDISQLAELLIVGAFLFGIGAVGESAHYTLGQAWVATSIALWVIDLGILHGLIRPRQRRYTEVAAGLVAAPVVQGSTPPQVAELQRLERAVAVGWALFNVVAVAVIFLMVFKPGG